MGGGLHSVEKAALVLRILATFSPRGAALAEVSKCSALPKATTHRILAALVSERLVERPMGTRLYRLGPELFAFGAGISMMFDFRDLAASSLERISEQTGEMALLGIRSGYDALCLDRHDGSNTPPDVLIQLMDRWPLGVGVFSLALLAFLADQEIEKILGYNQRRMRGNAQFSVDSISQALGKARAAGFASLTFPALPGSEPKTGIAVPVFDERKRPIASICIIAHERRTRGDGLSRCAAILKEEAALIAELYVQRQLDEAPVESWRVAMKTGIKQ
jgi:DNA-binding IclR family transcriptional regulator